MESRKYIKCDRCEKRIYFGDEAYTQKGLCGKYCSAKCYADSHADIVVIDEHEADNSCCEVFETRVRKTVTA